MATGQALLVICCSALCFLCMADLTCGACDPKFIFYAANHTNSTTNLTSKANSTSNFTLIIKKGSNSTVRFSVDTEGCKEDVKNNVTIKIRPEQNNKQAHDMVCQFTKITEKDRDTCIGNNKKCGCEKVGKADYFLISTEAKWKLTAKFGNREQKVKSVLNVVWEHTDSGSSTSSPQPPDNDDAHTGMSRATLIAGIVVGTTAVFILTSAVVIVVMLRRSFRKGFQLTPADDTNLRRPLPPLPFAADTASRGQFPLLTLVRSNPEHADNPLRRLRHSLLSQKKRRKPTDTLPALPRI